MSQGTARAGPPPSFTRNARGLELRHYSMGPRTALLRQPGVHRLDDDIRHAAHRTVGRRRRRQPRDPPSPSWTAGRDRSARSSTPRSILARRCSWRFRASASGRAPGTPAARASAELSRRAGGDILHECRGSPAASGSGTRWRSIPLPSVVPWAGAGAAGKPDPNGKSPTQLNNCAAGILQE